MRKQLVFLSILLLVFSFSLNSSYAVPNLISYQGILNDSNGLPMSTTVNMTFRIYNVSTSGTALWNETQNVQVANGLFNVKLGSIQQLTSDIFKSDTLYLGIQVGADPEMVPVQQITSGAYVFVSEKAETINPPVGTIAPWLKEHEMSIESQASIYIASDILYDDNVDFLNLSIKPGMVVSDLKLIDLMDGSTNEAKLVKEFILSNDFNDGNLIDHVSYEGQIYTSAYGTYVDIKFYFSDGTINIIRKGQEINFNWRTYTIPNPEPSKKVYKIEIYSVTEGHWVYIKNISVIISESTTVNSVTSANEIILSNRIFKVPNLFSYSIYSTPGLPTNWVECNGQTILDPDSYYYNQEVPDLNSTPLIEMSIPAIWILRIK